MYVNTQTTDHLSYILLKQSDIKQMTMTPVTSALNLNAISHLAVKKKFTEVTLISDFQ